MSEYAQVECLDKVYSIVSIGCTLTTTSPKLIKPSITNQFLDIILTSSLSYDRSPLSISHKDTQSGAPNV